MSRQLVSQGWQRALTNQRRRLNQTSGKTCFPPHFHYYSSSFSKHERRKCASRGISLMTWYTQTFGIPLWTTSPTTMSLLAVSQLWGKLQIHVTLTDSSIFQSCCVVVITPWDTCTWVGSLSANCCLPQRKEARVSVCAVHAWDIYTRGCWEGCLSDCLCEYEEKSEV